MDGTKSVTDTIECLKGKLVGRRSVRAEVLSQENMDLMEMRILVVVGS
jgi:hypothetical protein